MRPVVRTFAVVATLAILPIGASLVGAPAGAVVQDGVPDQASCDSGSVTPIWPQTGIVNRPRLTAITIDGESISPSRVESPLAGEIGAAICAQDTNFAKNSGLVFYRKVGAMDTSSNLTGALTPGGLAITASSQIVVSVDMGDLSPYFSFATVFGKVNSWATTGLRTATATLTASFSPVNGVVIDGRDDFGQPSPTEEGCTQQPPNCDPAKADADTFGIGMQFKAERGADTGFNSFAGGYFALQSAVGGFVAPRDNSLDVTIAGPHFRADGATLNVGSMSAFLPDTFLQQSFGLAAGDVTNATFAVTRTEGGETATAPWTYQVVPGGITVDVANITFSTPVYRISRGAGAAAPSGPTGSGSTPVADPTPSRWPAPPFFGLAKRGRSVTAGFAAAPGGTYVVTYTNLRSTYHSTVQSKVLSWKARFVTRKLSRGTWLVISRQKIGSGYSLPSIRVIKV